MQAIEDDYDFLCVNYVCIDYVTMYDNQQHSFENLRSDSVVNSKIYGVRKLKVKYNETKRFYPISGCDLLCDSVIMNDHKQPDVILYENYEWRGEHLKAKYLSDVCAICRTHDIPFSMIDCIYKSSEVIPGAARAPAAPRGILRRLYDMMMMSKKK